MVVPVAVRREAGGSVGHRAGEHRRGRPLAQNRPPDRAVEAAAAGWEPREDDVVSLGDRRHALAGLLDDPGPLVAEHDRQRIRRGARDHVPVGVADPARREPDAHLARPGRCEVEVLDREGLVDGPEDGSSHRAIVCRLACRLAAVKTRAAVLWQAGEPVEILEIDLAPPKEQEILVRIAACGVCASDLHVVDGDLPEPLPLVLGHEAAGVVVEVGPGVEHLQSGDHVVLALVPSCGVCRPCREGRRNFCRLGRADVRDRNACRRDEPRLR